MKKWNCLSEKVKTKAYHSGFLGSWLLNQCFLWILHLGWHVQCWKWPCLSWSGGGGAAGDPFPSTRWTWLSLGRELSMWPQLRWQQGFYSSRNVLHKIRTRAYIHYQIHLGMTLNGGNQQQSQKKMFFGLFEFRESICLRFCNSCCVWNVCLVHAVVKNLISILVTDYTQKRRGQALLFSFEYNLLPDLISNFNHYMDRAIVLAVEIYIRTNFVSSFFVLGRILRHFWNVLL